MRMNERMKKALSALLCVSMLAQNAPVVAFAAQEDCTHHAEHTQECGYVAAVEGKPCTHSHDTAVCGYVEEVKEELCDCTETDENGALVHTEGCSYVAPVAGSDCTHGHEESCGYVAAVEGRDCAYRCEICLGSDDEEEEEQETTAPSEPETTEAAEEVEPVEPIELHQTVTIPLELDAAEFDNDEAFAAYVDRLFYGDSGASTFGPLVGIRLQGAERVIYDRMKAHVAAIAAGTQPADFRISSDDLDVSITLAQTEIGTEIFVQDGETLSITEEAQKELLNRFFKAVNVQQVLYALLSDCPYELYWFDKASADIMCEMGAVKDENGALYAVVTDLILTLPVAKDYQVPGTGAMNTGKIAAAAAAAANARKIAAEHHNKTDYEKLVAYKNYICGEVSYNHEAVKTDYQGGYGDPWQMIYVFDENDDTNVVCEGYSKALQYLCDQSGVSCISVGGPFGDEESPGPHLWNIVTLEGKNYLVDLTNSDEDACGKNGELFLAGNASGSVETGYSFDVGTGEHAGTVTYKYDPAFVAIWDPANLTLAKENYPVPETPEAGECNHSGSTHSAVTDNRNETHSFTCTLCNTNVTVACSVNANGFCAKGCYEPAANVGDTYQIANAGNLYWFAAKVNNDNTNFKYANAILTADITVNENVLSSLNSEGANFREWTPIRQTSELSAAYSGKFDGDGHTISGLYVNVNADYVGFIGYLSGTVEDLRIEDSYFHGNNNVGGVAGYVHGGTLENCYNAGTVSGSTNVGGLTGYIYSTGAVKNCSNAGSVSSSSKYVGGVVGLSYTTVENCHNTGSVSGPTDVGGVVGETYGLVTDCSNTGTVTASATNYANVGGVVGTIAAGDYLAGEVSDCYNTGTVSGTGKNVGGLVGNNENAVTKSYNTGTVSGRYFVGGLVGFSENGSVTNSYNQGTVSGSDFVGGLVGSNKVVANSYNTGTVSGTGNHVGSVVGYNDGGTTQNCYYLAVGETHDNAAKTAAAFTSGEVAYLLQGEQSTQVWGQTCGQGLPALGGDKVYYGYDSCAVDAVPVFTNVTASLDKRPAHNDTFTSAGNGTHTQTCENCDYVSAPENCSGGDGTATCANGKICEKCETPYGEADTSNHNADSGYDVNGFCPNGCYECPELKGDTYQIANAGQLYWFAAHVNSGNNSAKAILTNDIVVNVNVLNADGTLSDNSANFRSWTPIGKSGCSYSGEFDGKDHTISGLYINENAGEVGLFGKMMNGTVKNLGIIDSYFRGKDYVGGLVGYMYSGTMTNCYNEGTVSGNQYVGGVTGYVLGGTVTDCHNTGSVSNTGDYTGGVAGHFGSCTVTNCYNTGDLKGTHRIGGVAGYFGTSTMTKCYNTGKVIGAEDVGGVAGTVSSGTVTNCYNTGFLSRLPDTNYFKNVGGLVGGSEGTVTNCYSTGSQETGTENYGSLVGINAGSVANCYYLSDSAAGDETAKTTAAFASGEVAYRLQNGVQIGETTYSGEVWGQILGQHTAPAFTETKVYYGYDSCAVGAQKVYTNNSAASEPQPGHSLGQQYTYDDNTHSRTCSVCSYVETGEHSFTDATCTAKAVCKVCGASTGEKLSHTYTYVADDSADTITRKCSTCDTQTITASLAIPTDNVYGTQFNNPNITGIPADYVGTMPSITVGGSGIDTPGNWKNAGEYEVNMTWGDKTVTGNTKFVVAKADPDYTIPANLTATYGDTLADVSLPTGFAWTDAAQSVGNVGTNTFTATYDLQNSNYNVIKNIAVPVKVAPKAVTSAVITVSGTHTYTGAQIKPDVTVADYAANTDYDVAYSNNIHAGTATVTVTFKGNYSGTVTETFEIQKAMLTVTADNKSATTGRDLPALTYTITGFVGGETASVLTAQPVAATTADGNTKGTYDITVSGAAAVNYDFTYVKGTLTVADHVHAWSYEADGAVITATCGNAATCSDPEQTITISAVGKPYDGTPVTAILTGNIDGVDTPAIRYFKNGTELIESAIHAGTYTAAIQLGAAKAKVDFTVAAKELAVTGAEIEAVTYNTAGVYVLEVSSVTLDGIVSGDTAEHSATAAFTGTNAAGSQEATVTVTLDNTDYVLKTAVYKTTVTVNKAVYTVSAPDEDDLVQTHFFAYATANTVDLTQHLPVDRGVTSYEVKPVTGDIFSVAPAVTEAGALSYTTRKLTAAPASDAEIRITVEMGNYEDVELKVPVKLLAVTAQTPQRIHHTDLTEVPAGLTDKFQSVAAIQETQRQVLVSDLGKTPDGIAHYDVNLQFSPDGGETWMNAAEENFPENGLTVTLPYPSGTGKDSHHFVVSHMFTSGEKAGTTEKPVVTKTAEGIQFTVTGLSPVSVAWSAIPFNIKLVPTTNGTVYVSSAQAAAGTQITVTVTPNYGYRLSTLTVLDDAGNYCVLGAVNDNAYMFHMPAANVTVAATFVSNSTAVADTTNPKTGDDFHMAFWGGMMMTTMLGVTALLLNRKKFFLK